MKRRKLVLLALILALVLSAGIGSAWAYFTTFAAAQGGLSLHLGYRTEFKEDVHENKKDVTISYDTAGGANTQEVYVRVRAWGPEDGRHTLSYAPDEGWVQSGDWWVYTLPLGPENLTAAPFQVRINGLSDDELAQVGDSINVVVVYECAPVLYKADGSAVDATDESIWSQQLITGSEAPDSGAEGGE